MSGGGRTQIRGKMGTKVRTNTNQSANTSIISQKALEDMQIKAEELQSQINFNQEEQGRLERTIHQLTTKLQISEAEVQKHIISIKSLEEQLPRIFKQLEVQKKRMEQTRTDQNKVKELETSIVAKKEKLKQAEEAAIEVNKKISDIKSKMNEVVGDKVKTVQSKISSIENQIKKLNANISKLKVETSNNERNVKKLEQQIERLNSDVLKAQNELKSLSEQRKEYDDGISRLTEELEESKKAIEKAKADYSEVNKEIAAIQKKESDFKLKSVEIEQKLQTISAKLSDVKSQIPHWREQLKPLRLHDIPGDTEPQQLLKTYTEEELATHTLQDIQYKESVQEELLKKKPNLSCIAEYIEKRDVYLERVKVLEDITCKRNEMRQLYDDVRKKRYNEFMQGFHIITRKLKEMYQMITQGGDAELELVDSMDPFTEGVSFSVRPPKKTWKNISNLSGGEKTLSSLALVFALHYYKPSPLYFMDEIDAALDFKNISIVAHYIKERTKNAQFIIISLRSNMFELSDYLVGIYKVKDCTDSVCIQNEPPKIPLMDTQQNQNQTQTQIMHSQSPQIQFPVVEVPNIAESTASPTLDDKSVSLNNSIVITPTSSAAKENIDNNEQESNENRQTLTTEIQHEARASNNLTFAPQGESTGLPSELTADKQPTGNMTFIPQSESTGLPQTFQMDVTRTSNVHASQNMTFSDNQFKKPFPPVTSN